MHRLGTADLGRVLGFLDEVASTETDEPFPPERLALLRGLVPCDIVSFSELDRVHEEVLGLTESQAFDCPELVSEAEFWNLRHEHPMCHHQDETGDFQALKLSDFLTPRALRRSRIYNDLFRRWGVEHELEVGLDAPLWHTKVFLFDRCGGRDFCERDRAVLNVLRPHLAQLYLAAQGRRRLREALVLHERTEAAIVLVEATNRIAFASAAARALLDRYFGGTGLGLPDQLASWLRERRRAAAPDPLRVVIGDRSLIVHSEEDALLLEERQLLPRLTPREREILDLVADGKTNAEIAERLWVSPGTVRRHLENVFAKLGVHTRTAAARFVREQHPSGPQR
jgi:RNA polymerase sigma factor (sigma-70 family)